MKSHSLVKYEGLRNPSKSAQELQNLDLSRPSDKQRQENMERTRSELGMALSTREKQLQNVNRQDLSKNSQFVSYTPASGGANAQSQQRIIQISTVHEDPLEPAKFRHKRIPGTSDSPPPVLMRSPARKLTAQDQKDCKVPACVSNWKNANGYTIPLHIRLQADGRGLQDTSVNEKFASLADTLYVAENQARKEIEQRNRVQEALKKQLAMKKEEQIRQAATLARAEKAGLMASSISKFNSEMRKETDDLVGKRKHRDEERALDDARRERDEIRHQRKREIERERRMEVAGKKKDKSARDQERDVSEKIALGQAQPTSREAMFDQRLFNQVSGLDDGFGHDDDYNIYDKPLFADRTAASIYKNVREVAEDEEEEGQGAGEVKKVLSHKPQRGFEGADYSKGARQKPVEFERKREEQEAGEEKAVREMGEPQKRHKH